MISQQNPTVCGKYQSPGSKITRRNTSAFRDHSVTQRTQKISLAKHAYNTSCWLNTHFLHMFLTKPDLVRATGRAENWEQNISLSNKKCMLRFCAEVFANISWVTHRFPVKSTAMTGMSDWECMFTCLYVHVEVFFDSSWHHPPLQRTVNKMVSK